MMQRSDNQKEPGAERLQKVLARCGVASRRGAEKLISAGRVAVNGQVVTELGTKVVPGRDRIAVDGREVSQEALRTVLFHKPAGTVCTREDPDGRRTIYDVLPPDLGSLAYVGRLDYNTSGLLLLTNDGQLNYRLTRPEYSVEKVYHAKVRGRVAEAELQRLLDGIEDDGEHLAAQAATVVRELQSNTVVELVLTEGKNREVRRLLEAIGHPVVSLFRNSFAGLRVRDLEPGTWRDATEAELASLHEQTGLTPGGAPC